MFNIQNSKVFMTTVCGFLNRSQTGPWSVTTKQGNIQTKTWWIRYIWRNLSRLWKICPWLHDRGCRQSGPQWRGDGIWQIRISRLNWINKISGFTTCEYKADQWTKKCKNLCAPITCRQRSKLGLLWQNRSKTSFYFKLSKNTPERRKPSTGLATLLWLHCSSESKIGNRLRRCSEVMHNGGSWKEGSRCARGQIGARGRGQVGWGCCGGGRRPAWQKVAWSVVHAGAILHGEHFATFDLGEGTQ